MVTNASAQPGGDDAQDFIAGEMAIGIIDGLEVIDIDHQKRNGVCHAFAGALGGCNFEYGAAIPEVGEDVDARFHLELFIGGGEDGLTGAVKPKIEQMVKRAIKTRRFKFLSFFMIEMI